MDFDETDQIVLEKWKKNIDNSDNIEELETKLYIKKSQFFQTFEILSTAKKAFEKKFIKFQRELFESDPDTKQVINDFNFYLFQIGYIEERIELLEIQNFPSKITKKISIIIFVILFFISTINTLF